MQYKRYSIIVILLSLVLVFISCNEKETITPKKAFRGVVLYPSDMRSIGAERLIDILRKADINLIGIHSNTITEDLDSLKIYLDSADGRLLIDLCKENKIDVEYECHVLQEILPRSLFDEHPGYFRLDSNEVRTSDLNMCFSSEEAWHVIEKNVPELVQWINPTTNRYFFWIDDSYDGFCHCDKCKSYSPSDQALIYENRMLQIIRKVNPEATLAHLAYASTFEAPTTIKPQEGIFLEFAPIGRNYADPLSSDQYNALKENLEIFPKETAHILEYWLDVSMFSNWERETWNKVPWNADYCKRDVELYQDLGIESFTTFATWMLHQRYFDLHGQDEAVEVLKEYGSILKKDRSE
ncbi:protein of unknown function [Porphyromonadaceae bacterium NLAE-zl-C104]|nr:protein of unknown function [Porphyromonadaceae bacterium NLAE-zl-C104]